MNTLEAIKTRRAIKHFDPNHKMSEAEINELLSYAIQSPTAFNIQNWRFVLVRDPELRKQVRQAAYDQAQVTDASLLIVLCADLKSWKKDPARYWRNSPQEVQEMLVSMIDGYYKGRPQVQRDEAMRSCGIVAQTIMLAAQAMGYDSGPMDGFDYEKVGQLINLPEDHVISMFVVVGKKVQDPYSKPGQLALEEVIIENTF